MPVLACANLLVRYGDDIILDGVSLSVEGGDRIGLVGRNGTGKSTLLKCLSSLQAPDSGTIATPRGVRVGYLRQDPTFDPNETLLGAAEAAFEELHRLHEEQHQLYDKMASATPEELERLLKQQEAVEARIEAAGGYVLEHRIEEVLHGLGFTTAQFSQRVGGLSGGQRGRLALAKLLLESPDVLLLDEPTNHLDIEGRIWLETFLRDQFKGTVMLVSHDRYLLDAVVNKIIETEQGGLFDYPGNYAKFRELRAQRRQAQLRAFEAQQDRFRKEEAYIRKYKAGQRARQAKGRETRLDREKASNSLERPIELDVFDFELPTPPRSGDIALSCRGLGHSFASAEGGRKLLFRDLDLTIERGERWGIIGPNGAGKTTLVKCLLGELAPESGVARVGSNVVVGYYRQTHDGLPMNLTVWQYLQAVLMREVPGLEMSEQRARDLAGAFLFSGDEQEKVLSVLSGGERSRAVLAGLLASAKNLLVLDEPTNHLDIPSAERLEEALSRDGGYEGTLLLISHDRALIDATCDHLLVLDGKGGIEAFTGNYTAWRRREDARASSKAKAEAEALAAREAADRRRRDQQAASKQAPRPKAPSNDKFARMKTEQLEQRIEKIQSRIAAIDLEMGDPSVWRNASKSQALSQERQSLLAELEPLEFEWARRADELA